MAADRELDLDQGSVEGWPPDWWFHEKHGLHDEAHHQRHSPHDLCLPLNTARPPVPAPLDQGDVGPVERAMREQPFDVWQAQWYRWRVGRKVGRTIYAQLRDVPSDDDVLIGTMDTPVLAKDAVTAHNHALRAIDVAPDEKEGSVKR